jgi:hypothetical protein
MNPLSLSCEIWVETATDDSAVTGQLLMQTHKMPSVHGQHGPAFRRGELKYFLVRQRLSGAPRFKHGQYVMPQSA